VLHWTCLPVKHFWSPFISYKENEVLWIHSLGANRQYLMVLWCPRTPWGTHLISYAKPGSAIAKKREPKSCLGLVFNLMSGCLCFNGNFMVTKNAHISRVKNSAQVLPISFHAPQMNPPPHRGLVSGRWLITRLPGLGSTYLSEPTPLINCKWAASKYLKYQSFVKLSILSQNLKFFENGFL
jgi:hypothetical protein